MIYGETLDSFPAQIYDPMMESENGFAIDLMNQLAWEMDTTIAVSYTHLDVYKRQV